MQWGKRQQRRWVPQQWVPQQWVPQQWVPLQQRAATASAWQATETAAPAPGGQQPAAMPTAQTRWMQKAAQEGV